MTNGGGHPKPKQAKPESKRETNRPSMTKQTAAGGNKPEAAAPAKP